MIKCKYEPCSKEFSPRVDHQLYCSRNCKEMHHKQRRYKHAREREKAKRLSINLNCKICGKIFHPKQGNQVTCSKPCSKEMNHRYVRINNDRQRLGYQKWLIAYKKTLVCNDCKFPGDPHFYVIEFHHARGIKKFAISSAIAHSKFKHHLNEIKEEIAKCDPLCVNCHRIRHHKEGYGSRYV